jgi:lipopolysaccharide/colanic/teichoic acid biosynthesis glycosyltransferase
MTTQAAIRGDSEAGAKVQRAEQHPGAFYLVSKRLLDALGACILLVSLLPMFAIVGLATLWDSGWPILYCAPRVGKGGRIFTIVKFRSMKAGADTTPHVELVRRLYQEGDDCGLDLFKVQDDTRVTRFGAVLRRTSIDELPQLWNVLRGEMSLVGPRPDVAYSVEAYEPWMVKRLEATPGMTGLWQVSGRSRVGLRQMLGLDVRYVEQRSLLLDLKILCMTVPAVLAARDSR